MIDISNANVYFVHGLHANLGYWLAQTSALDDAKIRDLNPDFPNLFQAVEMGLVLPETREEAVALMLQCFFWVEAAGYGHLWLPLVETALQILPIADVQHRFRLLKQKGQFQRLQRQIEESIATFQAARDLAQSLRDDQAMAEIHLNLGQVYYLQHVYDQAQTHSQEALNLLANERGRLMVLTLQNLGQIAQEQGDLAQAESLYRQALDITYQPQTTADVTRTMSLLATVLQQKGESSQALLLYREILKRLVDITNVREQVELYLNAGSLYYDQDQLDQAEEAFDQAQQLLRHSPGLLFHHALVCNNLGCVHRDREEWVISDSYFRQSVTRWRQIDDELMLATALGNWAQLYLRQKWIADALPLFQESLRLSGRYPTNTWAQKLHKQYSEIVTDLIDKGATHLEEVRRTV